MSAPATRQERPRVGSSVQSVTVRLTSAQAFDAFKTALTKDPQLQVQADTTRGYYAQQSEGLSSFIRSLGILVAGIMAIGAVAGALNSMYAAVSARTREIATLRAIGFRGGPVVLSVMIETMLLALAGGAGGALIAWLLFHHFTASTMGPNFSAVMFQFCVTPQLAGEGLRRCALPAYPWPTDCGSRKASSRLRRQPGHAGGDLHPAVLAQDFEVDRLARIIGGEDPDRL
jgi:hypothetical protein